MGNASHKRGGLLDTGFRRYDGLGRCDESGRLGNSFIRNTNTQEAHMGNQGYKPEAVASTLLGLVVFGSLIAAYTRDGGPAAAAGRRQPAPPANPPANPPFPRRRQPRQVRRNAA